MIARRGPIRARRATPRRSSRVRDPLYLAFVATLPCVQCGRVGASHAHHAGRRHGMGTKCDDTEAVPLCGHPGGCHEAWHRGSGPFAGLVQAERRALARRWIEDTQVAAARAAADTGDPW